MSNPSNVIEKIETEIISKGWGHEKIIVNNESYCGKILVFKKGARFSMHFHDKKDETFYCLSGYVRVTGIDTDSAKEYVVFLQKGETIHIPRLTLHRVEALEDSEIIEFSTQHFDSDSYRVAPGDSQQ